MAGLRDEVELDVSSALRQIDRIGASLTQATQQFSRDMARSLDTLRVSPNAGANATAGLTRASAAARQVSSDVDKVTKSTEEATAATGKYGHVLQGIAQVRVVQGLVAFFGGRALVGQVTDTVDAAAALNEQIAQAGQVFGSSQADIRTWAEGAVESVALARRQAIGFANDFGAMFRGMGAGEQQAASLAKTFVQLGADIASFKDVPIDDALVALRAGIAGENEPLRRLGFGFNDLEVKAKAAALGIHAVNGQLTTSQKAQATVQVILEKTALAQGDLARTGDSLVNQQRKLTAQASQLREDIGAALAPAFLDLVHAARENLPVLGEIASNLFPALISAFRAVLPVGLAFAQMLASFSPILTVVAALLERLPGPITQAALAFALFGTGIGPLPNLLSQFTVGMRGAINTAAILGEESGVLTGLAGGFAAINPWVAGLIVAVPVLTSIFGAHSKRLAEVRRNAQEAAAALRDVSTSVEQDLTGALTKELTSEADKGLLQILNNANIKIDDIVKAATAGGHALADLIQKAANSVGGPAAAFAEVDLAQAIGGVIKAYQDQAEAQAQAGVATGEWSKQQLDAAIRLHTVKGEGTNWLAVLNQLRPAIDDTSNATGSFGDTSEETASAMDDLDKALKGVKDTLDAVFGRFLDAEDATSKLRTATFELAKAFGEGRKKGESEVEFQQRLADAARDVAKAIQDRALALARSRAIDATAAGVQGEIRAELEQQIALFPQLRDQLQHYVDLIDSIPPDVLTTVHLQISSAAATGTDGGLGAGNADPWTALGTALAGQVTDGVKTGVDSNLGAFAGAGAAAGSAIADGVASSLRHSAQPGQGLDIAGFIIDGIDLGAAGAARDVRNFINGATAGLQGIVNDAMKIDPEEAQTILQAVADMDQATRDLAKARHDLGADSIEAAIAEQTLAAAQKHVNDVIIEATDSTKAYNDALKDVTDSVDSVTGAVRALQSVRDAQKAADDAAKSLSNEQKRLGLFDTLIAQQQAALDEARRRREAAGGTEPSIEEQRIQASLVDLQHRQADQADKVSDAQDKVVGSNLDLIDATQRLVTLGPQLQAAQGMWEGFFRNVSAAAGLTAADIQHLVDVITYTAAFAQNVSRGALTGNIVPIVPTQTSRSTAAYTAAAVGAPTSTKSITNNFYLGDGSNRELAIDVVDELRASEMA